MDERAVPGASRGGKEGGQRGRQNNRGLAAVERGPPCLHCVAAPSLPLPLPCLSPLPLGGLWSAKKREGPLFFWTSAVFFVFSPAFFVPRPRRAEREKRKKWRPRPDFFVLRARKGFPWLCVTRTRDGLQICTCVCRLVSRTKKMRRRIRARPARPFAPLFNHHTPAKSPPRQVNARRRRGRVSITKGDGCVCFLASLSRARIRRSARGTRFSLERSKKKGGPRPAAI